MDALKRAYFPCVIGLAAIGLLASLAVHACAVMKIAVVGIRAVWPLHVLCIASFLAALAPAIHRTRGQRSMAMPNPPRWMKLVLSALVAYATVNAAVMVVWQLPDGVPTTLPDGTRALGSHGRVVRTLDEGEYRRYASYELRGISGGWMVLSAAAMAIAALQVRRPVASRDPTDPS